MENSSNHQSSETELANARRFGTLVWADGNLFAYLYGDKIYVMEPPTEITNQLIEILESHPAYNEAENSFNEEVFTPNFEGVIFEEKFDMSTFDWASFKQLLHGGAVRIVNQGEEVKVEYIPPQEIYESAEVEEAPDSEVFDPAVVMHTIHEMAYSLRECRQLLAAQLVNRPFTLAEHTAVSEASELLTDYCSEFGVDMTQQDLKLDGAKLHLG